MALKREYLNVFVLKPQHSRLLFCHTSYRWLSTKKSFFFSTEIKFLKKKNNSYVIYAYYAMRNFLVLHIFACCRPFPFSFMLYI